MTNHDEALLALLHEERGSYGSSFSPPIYRTSTFAQGSFEALQDWNPRPPHFVYSRVANPTTRVLEEMVAKLEGGDDAIAFGSGMGGITAVMLAFLGHGDHVLCIESVYGPARQFLTALTERMSLNVEYFTPDADLETLIRPNTRLIYIESPTTFKFEVLDLRAISRVARAHGIVTAIDNTWATPLYQQPIKFGIDISLHSGTKYLNGHSDAVSGLVITSNKLMETLRPMAIMLGATVSAEDAFLIIRGMRTLAVRLAHHQASGLAVARWLQEHPLVTEVRHPGLPESPYYELGCQQMSGYSALFAFTLKAAPQGAAQAFAKTLHLFGIAPSWGGYGSLIVPIAIEPDKPTTFRLSIGLEPVTALIDELEHAIDTYAEFIKG